MTTQWMRSRGRMVYKAVISRLAQSQLSRYIGYIKRQLGNSQAAQAVLLDARETKKALLQTAESLPFCRDPDLQAMGYRLIHFRRHRYVFLYEVREQIVYVEAVYHELQDYENTFKREILH